MKTTDALYRQTLVRVGTDNMKGIDNLLDAGHHGIAERHTVNKLISYVKKLESELGISIPDPDKDGRPEDYLRVNQKGVSFLVRK